MVPTRGWLPAIPNMDGIKAHAAQSFSDIGGRIGASIFLQATTKERIRRNSAAMQASIGGYEDDKPSITSSDEQGEKSGPRSASFGGNGD